MLSQLLRLSRVHGGVHPHSHKDRSAALNIIKMGIPKKLFLPLRQHAGSDAVPVVKVGDRVLKGQLIALPPSEVSAPVHASSSGTVVAITDIVAPHPSGLTARSIVIETDGLDQWIDLDAPVDPFTLEPIELAQKVADAGVVGLGGAIFPAAVKLKQGTKHEIKTVIVNGSECEPYLTCDDRLMREKAEDIVQGARIIRYILNAYKVVIAIEDNKPEAIAAMREASQNIGSIEVEVVPARYPMGSAKQLIQEITGREVPAGARSTSVGALVHNAGTVYAIQQALYYGRPLVSRTITVAGECVNAPRNVEALIGTPVADLFEACGGLNQEPAQLLMGGPMMGMPFANLDAPVIKGATGVLALAKQEITRKEASPCIRCARCVGACPMGLLPLEMSARSRKDDFDGADEYGLKDCILCGSCSFVCPSHIPLVQYFQYAKGEQDQRRSAVKKTEYTQTLAEARTRRIEAEKAAKEAAKAAKAAEKKRKAEAAKAAKAQQQQNEATAKQAEKSEESI